MADEKHIDTPEESSDKIHDLLPGDVESISSELSNLKLDPYNAGVIRKALIDVIAQINALENENCIIKLEFIKCYEPITLPTTHKTIQECQIIIDTIDEYRDLRMAIKKNCHTVAKVWQFYQYAVLNGNPKYSWGELMLAYYEPHHRIISRLEQVIAFLKVKPDQPVSASEVKSYDYASVILRGAIKTMNELGDERNFEYTDETDDEY